VSHRFESVQLMSCALSTFFCCVLYALPSLLSPLITPKFASVQLNPEKIIGFHLPKIAFVDVDTTINFILFFKKKIVSESFEIKRTRDEEVPFIYAARK
jgi:hypothetical protein